MTMATMDLRGAERAQTVVVKPDERRQSSIAMVNADDDLEASLDLKMGVEAVAKLLAMKAVELTQLQRAHDEYVKSSCEYERELETEMERYEKKMLQLDSATLQLERDKSDLQSGVAGAKDEVKCAHRREHMLQTQLDEMKWKIQRLEQANDELETTARIAQATIEDLQHKAETMLEQNVFLHHEKGELLKQISSLVIAEVHPTPAGQTLPTRSSSARLSRKSSSHLTETAPATPVQDAQVNTKKGTKRKGRRPEVLETCLHLTCRKCRKNKPHRHNGGSEERGSVSAFFERIRGFLFGER